MMYIIILDVYNVVMVAIDMYGKSPMLEWIYRIDYVNAYNFNLYVCF